LRPEYLSQKLDRSLADQRRRHAADEVIESAFGNHTGHDESRGYGTKTREWQQDTVVRLETIEHELTNVSFRLAFTKSRARTPETRRDFQDVTIALINNVWVSSVVTKQTKPSPTAAKFLEALHDAFATYEAVVFQSLRAVKLDQWIRECVRRGPLDKAKPNSMRALFSKYKLELIRDNHIACNDDLVWLVPAR